MSYSGISIREALDKLNAPNNGWFLPQVQRQYVWGARHESEDYVCLLLDSLFKRYPIGGVVLWETNQVVPYRRFVGDYAPGQFAHQVDQGLWGASKGLIYDGQQRLQTLYSVLRHQFNSRVLHYDLLFDASVAESDETGFLFRDADALMEARYLRMTELASQNCTPREKVALEQRALTAATDDEAGIRIRENLSALWDIFVDRNVKSIAYFSVQAVTDKEVNEVFRRLNTGGVALTTGELVLGRIKALQSDYEERLWDLSNNIALQSGGLVFSSESILQFFHLLVKNTVRIDVKRLKEDDIQSFLNILEKETDPLVEVFSGYLQGLFKINHVSIVKRWLAILPIASYLTERKRHGHDWKIIKLTVHEVQKIHQYFLLSQFCGWETQTMVDAFAREASIAGQAGAEFPLDKIRAIARNKSRTVELHEYHLLDQPWLATKVFMPSRSYIFPGRKPQVDHIFPIGLADQDGAYCKAVDILWNLQPLPAEVNRQKSNRHPREFFGSDDGQMYRLSYDFIPEADSDIWNDHNRFVDYRKRKMLDQLSNLYGLTLAIHAPIADSDANTVNEP